MPTPFTLTAADGSEADVLADIITTPEGGGVFGLKIGLSLGAVRAPASPPPPPATPQLTGGTVNPNGTTFSLTFSGAVAADFADISFTLDGTPGAAFGYINGTGTVVSGEIYSTVYQGQTVTVSGGGVPFLVSSPGGVGVSFSGVTITNGSEQAPVPPAKIDVFRMDPSTISVAFDQNVSGDSFTGSVTVDGGVPVAVSFGDYLGPNQITLVCAEALPPGVTLLTCTATNLVGSPGGVPVETFADYPVS